MESCHRSSKAESKQKYIFTNICILKFFHNFLHPPQFACRLKCHIQEYFTSYIQFTHICGVPKHLCLVDNFFCAFHTFTCSEANTNEKWCQSFIVDSWLPNDFNLSKSLVILFPMYTNTGTTGECTLTLSLLCLPCIWAVYTSPYLWFWQLTK